MTVEQKQVIDVMSLSKDEKIAIMTISDHLDWDDEHNHMLLLQDKINVYLGTIENEEIYEVYPQSKGKKFEIRVCAKYDLTKNAKEFINKVKNIVENGGYTFVWEKIS